MFEGYPSNIKESLAAGNTTARRSIFYTQISPQDNPFVEQIQDSDKLKELFRDRPFVPYQGTNQKPQHTLLQVLKTLSELSPTQAAVLNSMSFYCFGGKVSLINSVDSEFEGELKKIEGPQAAGYFEALKQIKPKDGGFRGLAKRLFKARKYSGEHYLMVRYYEIAGARRVSLDFIDNLKIMPLIPEPGQPTTYITFDDELTDEIIQKKKYDLVTQYPFFSPLRDGGNACIISYINGTGLRGRPDETGIMIDQYREYKDNIFLTRQSANNFTPQVLIEYEDADPAFTDTQNTAAIEQGFKSLGHRMRHNTSNNSESPQSMLFWSRPPGAAASLVHEFSQNTSEKWFNITGTLTQERILDAHSWPKDFLDGKMTTGFSTTAFIDKLIVKLPLIEAHAAIEESTINKGIDIALTLLGVNFEGVDIKFNNPYESLLNIKKEAATEGEPEPINKI